MKHSQLNSPVGPTLGTDRIAGLDITRGVAILGVLLAYTVWSLGSPPAETWSALDRVLQVIMDVFVDGKFVTTFSFLFGVGVAQQWRRWEASTPNVKALHLRRMGFLLAIGLAHGALLRNGDILAPYAILGMLLLAFRNVSFKKSAVIAVLLFVTPWVVRALVATLQLPWPERPSGTAGSYWADNLLYLRYWYLTNPLVVWPQLLGLMIMGLAAGRARLFERIAGSRMLARRALAWSASLAVGTYVLLMACVTLWHSENLVRNLTVMAIYHTSAVPLAGTYASLVLVLAQRPAMAGLLSPLRTLGRMAFTNYLLQAIVVPFCLIFGLFDKVTPTRGLLLSVAVAVIQVRFSTWWLSRYQMGPFERLWRRFTYGSTQAAASASRARVATSQ